MSKERYINFAKKKKYKVDSGSHTSFDQNRKTKESVNSKNCKPFLLKHESEAKPTLKYTMEEEDAEITRLLQCYQDTSLDTEEFSTFKEFPLSKKTQCGLQEAGYMKPTIIQRSCILPALRGEDLLAAARTGSGKTLAFLIPVVERLFSLKWTRLDGLGALIITPTRELALQIFDTISRFGRHHDFTTGLIIGGQNLKNERRNLHNLNIMISTPGRLLQHMDQNPLFDATNLKMLILDEADRCLDLGFASTMDSIFENIPSVRQTLLFSATQTKSVYDLARVNLNTPRYIAPHEQEPTTTPIKLQQSYVVIELRNKLTLLWSFLRSHSKQKIIVFFATCKQVKYCYQLFKKLRPSNLLLPLYGGMNQEKRNKIYAEFCEKKKNVCLFATDVASRGLDFPRVNWVLQLDCPEDVDQYIHRAGRTARLNTAGESLLVLIYHEVQAMLEALEARKIPIKMISINERQLFSPLVKIQSLLAQSPELKESAKRAFVAYIKSVALMKNKNVFQPEKLKLNEFALSLGLNATPRIRFLMRATCKNRKEKISVELSDSNDEHTDEELLTIKRANHDADQLVDCPTDKYGSTAHTSKSFQEFLISKKRISKARMAKKLLLASKHTVFDEEGNPLLVKEEDVSSMHLDIEEAKLILQNQDVVDKERYKKLKKSKRKAQKEKQRKYNEERQSVEMAGVLDGGSENMDLDWLPDPDRVFRCTDFVTDSCHASNLEQGKITVGYNGDKKRCILQKTRDLTLNEAERIAINFLR